MEEKDDGDKLAVAQEPISHMAHNSSAISEEEIIRIRKEKLINFFKTKYEYISYLILAIIVYLAIKIRTSNLSGLKDITTGTWTLGPDLDPFLFLRWAKYIVEHGSLFAIDTMRYVPLGYDVRGELLFLPYSIAWFHKIATFFGSASVTQSAVMYPVFMFGLTVIAFFFMTRKIFLSILGKRNSNVAALVASFFLTVMPPLLPRTIAGIPEKESAAFLFMFLTFYFFMCAWGSDRKYAKYVYAILAGISTGTMALIWGGYSYIFAVMGVSLFISFLFEKINKERLFVLLIWIVFSFTMMNLFSTRYVLFNLFSSTIILLAIFPIMAAFVEIFVVKKLKNKRYLKRYSKIPEPIIALVILLLVGFLFALALGGPAYVIDKINDLKKPLIKPVSDRVGVTVAENRQPYFPEWESSFGPYVLGIAISFWVMICGAVLFFFFTVRSFEEKKRLKFTLLFLVLLMCVVFSRYKPDSLLNGDNSISIFLYLGSISLFLVYSGFYYYRCYSKTETEKLKRISFGNLLLLSFFFIGIISARGSVRTIMVLVPASAAMISFISIASVAHLKKIRGNNLRMAYIGAVVLILGAVAFCGYSFYIEISSQAAGYVPSIYTQQWQKAMQWVRENTAQDAVFGHWWDYGYWLQSIGERATVLDGGNAVAYWNHFTGRYALTGTSSKEAAEFLYAHNTTHFLIDSTDIGKYSAFSSIGSDVNYDRASYIPTFYKDNQATQETKNATLSVYQGGASLDEDIIYEENNTKIFLPKGGAGIGAILIERNSEGKIVSQPIGIYVYQGKQYNLPMRYAFDKEFIDFGKGIESGFFIYPRAVSAQNGLSIEPDGAMLYLSGRTVNSQLARLYLYGQDDEYFEMVHSEDDLIVSQIKSQSPTFNYSFLDYQGFRGPIKIWEISYPEDIELKEEFLETEYPKELLYP